MLNLLIVDDEFFSLEKVQSILNSEPSFAGYFQIETADDGVNALRIIQSGFIPHIVITDVRMPRMDGVALAWELKRAFLDPVILFMSSYSDKEYLMSAIALNAVCYIEKPFTREKLVETVTEAVHRQAAGSLYEEKETIRRLRKEEILRELLKDSPDYERIYKKAGILYPFSRQKCFVAPLFLLYDRTKPDLDEEIREFFDLYEFRFSLSAYTEGGCVGLVIAQDATSLSRSLRNLIRHFTEVLPGFTVCLGTNINQIENVSFAFLKQARNVAFLAPEKRLLSCADLSRRTKPLVVRNYCEPFAKLIRDGKPAAPYLYHVTGELKRTGPFEASQLRTLYFQFCRILQENEKMNYRYADTIDLRVVWDKLKAVSTINEAANYVVELEEASRSSSPEHSDTKSYIRAVLQTIRENYADTSLSPQTISAGIHLSPSYLSMIFHEATGQTLVGYISGYRMDRAAELLQKGLNVTETAKRVGIVNLHYFSKVFKKYVGCSPSAYKKDLLLRTQVPATKKETSAMGGK